MCSRKSLFLLTDRKGNKINPNVLSVFLFIYFPENIKLMFSNCSLEKSHSYYVSFIGKEEDKEEGHIMISYNWGSQETVIQIANKLKASISEASTEIQLHDLSTNN